MPCQYLTSLVHLIADRAIVVYDHIGVGQSKALNASVLQQTPILQGMVNDLKALIEHCLPLNTKTFHLLGHSLGGIVAFEFLKQQIKQQQQQQHTCLSVILANTPSSIAASHNMRKNLVEQIHHELLSQNVSASTARQIKRDGGDDNINNSSDEDDDDDDDDDEQDPDSKARIRLAHHTFGQRHECRVSPMPLVLQQSLTGLNSTLYSDAQHNELQQYVADSTDLDDCSQLPPALILRGQHDFVSSDNANSWSNVFIQSQFITVQNSSHYGMLENENLYGDVVTAFLHENDG